jgi:hypothetical protein
MRTAEPAATAFPPPPTRETEVESAQVNWPFWPVERALMPDRSANDVFVGNNVPFGFSLNAPVDQRIAPNGAQLPIHPPSMPSASTFANVAVAQGNGDPFASDQDFNDFVNFLSQTEFSWVNNLDENSLQLLRDSLPNQQDQPPAGGGIRRTQAPTPVPPESLEVPEAEDDPRRLLMHLWGMCPRVPSLDSCPQPPKPRTMMRSPPVVPSPGARGGFAPPPQGLDDPGWPYSVPAATRKGIQDFLHAAELAKKGNREAALNQAVKFQEQMINAESLNSKLNDVEGVSPKVLKTRSNAEGSTISGSEESSTSPDSSWSGGKRDSTEIQRNAEGASQMPSVVNERNAPDSSSPGTMVMMCNLPNNRDAEQILAVLEKLGFKDAYDYFYLPVDRHCMCNKGYGFVHFVRVEDAYRFIQQLEGFRFERSGSSKTVTACIAKRQGVVASLKACIKSPHRLLDGKSRGRVMSHCPWVRVKGQIRCLSPTSAYNAYVEETSRAVSSTNSAEHSDAAASQA